MSETTPNSALYWLPAAESAAEDVDRVHTPETELVDFDFWDAVQWIEDPDGDVPMDGIQAAGERIGYPVFLRTDVTSAELRGQDAVRVEDAEDFSGPITRAVEACVNSMGTPEPQAFLVREWIDVEHEFRAFDGLPIGVEYRLFATPDEHLCTHYYWPAESIRRTHEPEERWRELREKMASVPINRHVQRAARAAARHANDRHEAVDDDQAWSVDVALTEDREWYLIDMALAERSWHLEDCEYAKTEAGAP